MIIFIYRPILGIILFGSRVEIVIPSLINPNPPPPPKKNQIKIKIINKIALPNLNDSPNGAQRSSTSLCGSKYAPLRDAKRSKIPRLNKTHLSSR